MKRLKSEKATGSYYPENTEPPGDIRVVSNMKENLHFFAAYRGKRYTYTALGKNFQALDEHPQTFSLGLIYKIPIL